MVRLSVLVIASLLLVGCSGTRPTGAKILWDREGTPEEIERRDLLECGVTLVETGELAGKYVVHERDTPEVDACMRARGYETNPG